MKTIKSISMSPIPRRPSAPSRVWQVLGLFVAVAILSQAAGLAEAAKPGNAQVFRPSPHSLDLFQAEGARVNWWGEPFDWRTLNAAAMFNYVDHPLGSGDNDGLESVGTLNLMASMAFWSHLSLGIDMPLHVLQKGSATNEGFALGDLRIGLKGAPIRPRKYGIGMALGMDIIAPIGAEDVLTSERGLVIVPKLILEGVSQRARFVLNVAYLKRLEEDVGGNMADELETRLGLGIPLGSPMVTAIVEATFASVPDSFYEDAVTRLEGDAGLRIRLKSGLAITFGGGAGMLEGAGDPTWRAFAGLGWQPASFRPLPPKDQDGDGFFDVCDGCPLKPEDRDGYQDQDGCPDLDNDQDGIPDINDSCPMEPEDKDGFQDEDGCPEPDNDADGLLDPQDRCPNDPEDVDSFEDEDGCPDLDNDRDGVPDVSDTCPMKPETVNGYMDEDGCPDTLPMVYMTKEKIVITQKIFFKKGRDTILKKSFPVLKAVARILGEHPEILRIRVEGHTSSEGSHKYNVRLSDKRAKAIVKFLAKTGVDKERLEAIGYGPDQPLVPVPEKNETEREQNRRVEFTILDQK